MTPFAIFDVGYTSEGDNLEMEEENSFFTFQPGDARRKLYAQRKTSSLVSTNECDDRDRVLNENGPSRERDSA